MSSLSDADRLEVIQEIWALAVETDRQMLPALYEYERRVKERMLTNDTMPSPPPDEQA